MVGVPPLPCRKPALLQHLCLAEGGPSRRSGRSRHGSPAATTSVSWGSIVPDGAAVLLRAPQGVRRACARGSAGASARRAADVRTATGPRRTARPAVHRAWRLAGLLGRGPASNLAASTLARPRIPPHTARRRPPVAALRARRVAGPVRTHARRVVAAVLRKARVWEVRKHKRAMLCSEREQDQTRGEIEKGDCGSERAWR